MEEQSTKTKKRFPFPIVTDPDLIKKYDSQTLYVPPHEKPETLDLEKMRTRAYAESAEDDGEFRAIEVTVWEEDPNKDDPVSHQRFHLRIANGRHRYFQDATWKRVYYMINSPLDYWKIRKIADMQKQDTPQEITTIITEIAELLLQTEIILPKDCCDQIIKRKLTKWYETTVRRHCPPQSGMSVKFLVQSSLLLQMLS